LKVYVDDPPEGTDPNALPHAPNKADPRTDPSKVDHRAAKSLGVAQGTVFKAPVYPGSLYSWSFVVAVDVPAAGGVDVIAPEEGRFAAATLAASAPGVVAPVVGVAGMVVSTTDPVVGGADV
jgi:hypothetical protein